MRLALATLTRVLATAGLAIAQNDVVELKNGDRISGTIQQMDGELLVINTPYTEKLKIDWKQVVAVTTETPSWSASSRTSTSTRASSGRATA